MKKARMLLVGCSSVLVLSGLLFNVSAEICLIDTIQGYIKSIGNRILSEKKIPKDIFKQYLGIGVYGVFERKGNNYELKKKYDQEDVLSGENGGNPEGVHSENHLYVNEITDPESNILSSICSGLP